jgi:amino acid transporter
MTTHTLGFASALIIGMNAMIGAGIFSLPSALVWGVGPLSLLAYACSTLLVMAMAFALARVATQSASHGAFFEYTRLWAGRTGGLIAAVLYTGGLIVALGLLAQITGAYCASYHQSLDGDLMGTIVIGIVGLLVCLGGKANQVGQIVLLILTLLPMALIACLSLSTASLGRLIPFAPHGFGTLIPAIKSIVFGFFGFEAIPALARYVKNPQKTVGRAILASVAGVGLIYCAFVASILIGLPAELFTQPDTPLSAVLAAQFPQYPWIVESVRLSIIITIIGTIHAMLWALSELISSCSGEFFANRISPRSATIGCCILIVMCLWSISSIDLFFSATALLITLTYAAAIVPLITVLNRSWQDAAIGIVGLTAAFIIILCAADGLAKHLIESIF